MRNLFLSLILPIACCAQTAVFPSAVATDANLKVAVNRLQSNLTATAQATDTVLVVASTTGYVANMLVSVDNEIISICGVAGANILNVGHTGACPNINGRGFDGTVAAIHLASGATCAGSTPHGCVAGLDTAWHRNSDRVELEAIETALGPGLVNVLPNPLPLNKGGTGSATQAGALSNILGSSVLGVPNGGTGAATLTGVPVGTGAGALTPLAAGGDTQYLRSKPNQATRTYEFAAPALVSSGDYNFPAQSPAGSLIAGADVVTLAPCPQGVGGSDPNHWLWIAGTGTPEAVLITGGTCASGAASGTVIFTAANSHAAGFTVASAAGGLPEAISWSCANSSPAVYISSAITVNAKISIPASCSPEIYGSLPASLLTTSSTFDTASGDIVSYTPGNAVGTFRMHDFAIMTGVRTSGYGIAVRGMNSGLLSNIRITGSYNSILLEGGNGEFSDNLHLTGFVNIGVDLHSTAVMGGVHRNWIMSGSGTAVDDLLLRSDVTGGFAGMVFDGLDLQLALYNIELNSNGGVINETLFSNTLLDSALTNGWGIYAHGSPGGNGIHFTGLRASTAGGGILNFSSLFSDVMITNCSGSTSSAANVAGFQFQGTQNVSIANCSISGNGQGNAANTSLVITVDAANANQPVNMLRIANSSFGYNGTGGTGAGNIAYNGATISAAAHTNIVIADTAFYGTNSYITDSGTQAVALSGFLPGVTNVAATVASAATVAMPLNPVFTLTGTTAVTNVTVPLAVGARWQMTATNATPGSWTAGGLLGNTFTPVQNVPVQLYFDGSKIWKVN